MPAALAAKVATLSLEDLATFVRALPRIALLSVMALADDQVWAERLAHAAPVVVTAATPAPEILTADEAAHMLRVSLDTLYARVERGELAALPRPPKGRLRFARASLVRYTPDHDRNGRANPPPPPRMDATRPRRRAPGDSDNGRPVGARGARRHAARGHEPYAPGQAAWRDDPDPKG